MTLKNKKEKGSTKNSGTKVKNGKSALNGIQAQRKKGESYGSWIKDFHHYYLGPLFIILSMPNFFLLIIYTNRNFGGSILELSRHFMKVGVLEGIKDMWASVSFANPIAMAIVLGYCLFALTLQKLVPGERVTGTQTPTGHTPEYTDNGFRCYAITMITLGFLTYVLKTNYGVSPTIVFDIFGDIVGFLLWFGLIVSILLYIKGHIAPTGTDTCITGHPFYDFYVGTELYPRIFGIDVKVFTNCRFGMTVWPILVVIYTIKSYELHGFVDSMWVSTILHIAYITKFFWWEAGYYRSIDIILDGAGFMICWGCIVAIPSLYAAVSFYLTSKNIQLGPALSLSILFVGLASLALNYYADWQRQLVRASDRKCTIWGKKPEFIRAKYTLENGQTKCTILLASGMWGIARHFNYIPELTLAFSWCVPALLTNLLPYAYFIFLVILLVHRSTRDEEKCSIKYGPYWKEYCKRVPYSMLPGIY